MVDNYFRKKLFIYTNNVPKLDLNTIKSFKYIRFVKLSEDGGEPHFKKKDCKFYID